MTLQYSPALPGGAIEEDLSEEDASASMARSSSLPGPQPQGTHVPDVDQVAPAVPALRAVVQERCPALANPESNDSHFFPTTYLSSGHLQTIYSSLRKKVAEDVVHYHRRVLLTPDGGTLSLDVAPPERAQSNQDDTTPTLIVITGLTGGSSETYVRHIVRPLVDEKKWRAVVMNYRGCAHTPVTSGQLYSASKTSDMATTVLFCQQNWPRSPLVAVGFSLGANVVAKYFGECGDATPLRGGLVLAGPFDLTAGSHILEGSTFNEKIYSRTMCANLTRVALRGADTLALSPRLRSQLDRLTEAVHVIKTQAAERNNDTVPFTIRWFDDNIMRIMGGYQRPYGEFPFEDAWGYYRGGSSTNVLHRVARPLLAIHAKDDPVVPYRCAEGIEVVMGTRDPHPDNFDQDDPGRPVPPTVIGRGNPNLVLATTEYGGHLGWWSGAQPTRWIRTPSIQWLTALAEAPECQALQLPPNPHSSGGTVSTPIKVDVFPHTVLRPYVTAAVRRARDACKSSEDEEQAEGAAMEKVLEPQPTNSLPPPSGRDGGSGAGIGNDRLAFLTTPVLGDTELLHPFQHEWYQDALLGEQRRNAASTEGTLLAMPLTMVQDKTRMAVGYAELPPSTRVAGAGDTFLAASDVPGEFVAGKHAEDQGEGVVAGL